MAMITGRPRAYFYVISDNDELELPRLVTDSVEEAAQFLGVSVSGIYHHFTSGYERAGGRDERGGVAKVAITQVDLSKDETRKYL